jgi:hypothetical protein
VWQGTGCTCDTQHCYTLSAHAPDILFGGCQLSVSERCSWPSGYLFVALFKLMGGVLLAAAGERSPQPVPGALREPGDEAHAARSVDVAMKLFVLLHDGRPVVTQPEPQGRVFSQATTHVTMIGMFRLCARRALRLDCRMTRQKVNHPAITDWHTPH